MLVKWRLACFGQHSQDPFRFVFYLQLYHTRPFQKDSAEFRVKLDMANHLNAARVE